jgi:protease I
MPTRQRVAVLVDNEYQDLEFWYPVLRLREEGIPVTVVGVDPDRTYLSQLEYPVIPELGIGDAQAKDFTAVIVPGGGAAAHIAGEPRMLRFIADAAAQGALLGATADGVVALAAAGALAGRRVAARAVLGDKLRRADAQCVDEPVVTDGRLLTARSANELPAFCRALFAALATAVR